MTNNSDNTVSRVDPATNRVTATIPVPDGPGGLTFAAGTVWVGSTGGDSVYRIDPATNAVTRVPIGHTNPVWFSGDGGNAVGLERLGRNRVAHRPVTGEGHRDGARTAASPSTARSRRTASGSRTWRTGRSRGIDPTPAKVVGTLRVGPEPFVLTVAFGDVWSPAWGGNRIWRIHPG